MPPPRTLEDLLKCAPPLATAIGAIGSSMTSIFSLGRIRHGDDSAGADCAQDVSHRRLPGASHPLEVYPLASLERLPCVYRPEISAPKHRRKPRIPNQRNHENSDDTLRVNLRYEFRWRRREACTDASLDLYRNPYRTGLEHGKISAGHRLCSSSSKESICIFLRGD